MDSKYIITNHKLQCLESLCDLEHAGRMWYNRPSESFLSNGYTKNGMFSVSVCNTFLNVHCLSTEFQDRGFELKEIFNSSKPS